MAACRVVCEMFWDIKVTVAGPPCVFQWPRSYTYLRESPEHVSHIIFSFINLICLVVRIDILAEHQPCENQLLITEPEINTETMEVRFKMPLKPSWEETIELFCSVNFKYIIILCLFRPVL